MPEWLLSMYLSAMPRLEAEESQSFIRNLAAGTNNMKKAEFNDLMKALERVTAAGWRGAVVARPRTKEEFEAMAADIAGFRVKYE